jgi:hypothetical protein
MVSLKEDEIIIKTKLNETSIKKMTVQCKWKHIIMLWISHFLILCEMTYCVDGLLHKYAGHFVKGVVMKCR